MTPAVAATADARRWYVVQTLPRLEATAETHLARQGFEAFLPRIHTTRRHARRIETIRTALFPGYAFVRLDLTRQRWRSVNGTQGVATLIMGRELPLPVPPGVVEALCAATTADGVVDLTLGLKPGDPVRLVGGPFAGRFGTLMHLDQKGRVEMLLSLVNGDVRLRLTRDKVVPAL